MKCKQYFNDTLFISTFFLYIVYHNLIVFKGNICISLVKIMKAQVKWSAHVFRHYSLSVCNMH